MEESKKYLDQLDKASLVELKSFRHPPNAVVLVMNAVLVLMKIKPNWNEAKKFLGNSNVIQNLLCYDIQNISQETLEKLTEFTSQPEWNYESIKKVSNACSNIFLWVENVIKLAKLYSEHKN
ncbi:unnamed protein product [Brachionus calyciflorus]|uniref:Dynein heavy chain coiled coil stalk domain-containing protein n=1 Tax=Brachionus calyciflorus TaxID=104777 RepID=A0A813M522_9BILA|nr:unnamed protein product [Brachionus calyciflorus]